MSNWNLQRLSLVNGSWGALKNEWHEQCENLGEDFETYAQGTFDLIEPLAGEEGPKAGVFGLKNDTKFAALCQINCAMIPSYTSPVLRVRFITLSPDFDFGEKVVEEYASVLLGIFSGALKLSFETMPCKHLKFHLQSPADRQFFAALEGTLGQLGVFESVQTRGSWLYVTKN